MIDPKVFAELQNREIITNVGLDSNDYNNLTDLEENYLVTQVAADVVYDKLVNETSKEETSAEDPEVVE
jgi:hypothetical protein